MQSKLAKKIWSSHKERICLQLCTPLYRMKPFPWNWVLIIFDAGVFMVPRLLVICSRAINYYHLSNSEPNMVYHLNIFMAIRKTIDIIKHRPRIDHCHLLALTRNVAAILVRSSAPLSVICLTGAMKCRWILNWFSRDFFLCKHHTYRHDTGHMVWHFLIFIIELTVIEYSDMRYMWWMIGILQNSTVLC